VAIQYALGRWMALLRYVNGRLEIDNNVPLSVRYWR
jgi:hypothetical protein